MLLYTPKHWKSRVEELVLLTGSCASPDLIAFLSNTVCTSAESFQLLPNSSALLASFFPSPARFLSHMCFLTVKGESENFKPRNSTINSFLFFVPVPITLLSPLPHLLKLITGLSRHTFNSLLVGTWAPEFQSNLSFNKTT